MSEAALLRRVIDNLPELMARVRNVEVRECNGSSICGYAFDCSKAPADGDLWQFDSQSGIWGHVTPAVAILGADQLTISGGVIALTSTALIVFVTVDTEGAAANDDLDTINGGAVGQILILAEANSARDVTVKDGTGNMNTAGDFAMSDAADTMVLYSPDGASWRELSRSNNA